MMESGFPERAKPVLKLNKERLQEQLRNPSFLPKTKEITQAFDDSHEFRRFCFSEKNPVFELFNEEFITALTDYLSERITSLRNNENEKLTILEVGAGDGRLTHFLQEKIKEKGIKNIDIIATDIETDSEKNDYKIKSAFPVEKISNEEALKKYNPEIAISCWMPLNKDFSKDFRETKSIKEYILIGSDNCCGNEWLTYGIPNYQEEYEEKPNKNLKTPPYIMDGFKKTDLKDISNYQISRVNSPEDNLRYPDGYPSHSYTCSFKREERTKPVLKLKNENL